MNKISCCRVCLADNVKTHSLIDSPFQELYEILTNTKVHQQEGKSTAVCYLCHAVLLQCYKFQQTARRSEALLAQLYLDGVAVTDSKLSLFSRPILHSYVTTTVEHINIYTERDRYTYSGKLERDGECLDNSIKEENGDDHDTTNTHTLDSYESRKTSTSTEATLEPRQDSFDTRQRTKLYLEIDGLKKSIMQDFGIKVNSKETYLQELTSDSELMSSNRNLENYTSLNNTTLNSTRNNGEFDSTKSMPFKNTSFNQNSDLKQYKSQIASQNFKSNKKFDNFKSHNLDSRYDTNKMCNRNTKYIHYNQNLKLDNSTIYDTQEFIAKKVNSRLLKMVYDSPTDQNVNTSNVSQNPNVNYNVSENLNLNYNVSQNPNLIHNISENDNISYEISENLNLTSKASSMDNDESRLTDTQPYESDSEDDLPLKMLRKRGKKLKDEKQTSKREYRKASNLGSSVLHISKPDQLAALTARASSHNYLHATYKCEYCYRGFLTKEVYSKHMEKHDEARGPYACPVCWLRYRSPRLLAAHARAAHERRYQCTACHHVATTKNQAIDHQRIHNGDLFECKMCSKSFHARTTYLSHMRARHPTAAPSAVCSICGDRFVSAQGLAMHRAKMHADNGAGESSLAAVRGFVCVSCGERFEDQQELNEHRNDKHRDGMEEDSARATTKYCSTCDIHFASRRAYARHMLSTPAHMQLAVHTKECPICLQTIMGTVRSHMRIHDKETRPRTTKPMHEAKLLHCDQCSQSFATKSRLNAHVRRVHLGLKYNKNLVCEVCGNKCTSAARLRYHQRTHTGERPYPCLSPGCGARLADSNQLRIHTRTHTGERPYTCHTCGASFAQKPALNRHNRVHTGVKPHTCDICNKSFTQSNSLNTHIRSVHLKMPRKLYSKTTYVRKTSQNTVEPKKNGDLAVSVSGQLTSNVTIVQSSEISDVTLVDSQVQSKLSLGHQ